MVSMYDRQKDHWNRIDSSEVDSYTPGNGLLTKVETKWRKRRLFKQSGTIGYIPVQKN